MLSVEYRYTKTFVFHESGFEPTYEVVVRLPLWETKAISRVHDFYMYTKMAVALNDVSLKWSYESKLAAVCTEN